jgi:hypothetical protein
MTMGQLPPALPHDSLEEVFTDVFFVTGMMKATLMNADWQFSRNMTVVRNRGALTLINSIRLDESRLAQLEELGHVANVVRIGSLHGRDDAFYNARYGAKLWALPGMIHKHGLKADREFTSTGEMPFAGCSVFDFRTTKLPEGILHIDRADGILVACDSLQNWVAPDQFFSAESRRMMTEMSYFQPANFGPLWMSINEPQKQDFFRLLNEFSFRHVLCGHGEPLRDIAREAYAARIQRAFGM